MPDYDKTKPDGSLPINVGDNDVRDNFDSLEERLSKEHQFPGNPLTAPSGRHKFGVGNTTARDAAYTIPHEGAGPWYNTTTNTIQMYASGAWRNIAPISARGDILIGDMAGYASRLGVGSVGHVLQLNYNEPTWHRPPLPRGAITGLKMVRTAARLIRVNIGAASIGTENYINGEFTLHLPAAMTKDLNATWVAGNGNGGRAPGVPLSADTWYHVFLIGEWGFFSDDCDVGFDTDIDGTNIDGGGTYWARRIGSILTDSSSNIIDFVQRDRTFLWKSPLLDIDTTIGLTTAVLQTLTVPPDVNVEAIFNAYIGSGSAGDTWVYFSSPDVDDEVVSETAAPLGQLGSDSGDENMGHFRVYTNTTQQIRRRASATPGTLRVATLGYVDEAVAR